MKLSLLFTSLIALSVAAPSPEAAPEAEGAAVAGGRYHHSGYRTDKCGNREGSQYGQMRIQYGDEHNRVRQHDVPVFCGGGDGVVVGKLHLSPSFGSKGTRRRGPLKI